MVAFSLVFTILLSVASSTAFTATTTTQPIGRRTTAEVLDAISNVSTALTRLDDLVTAYPMTGGTITGAFDIHNNSTALNAAINSATAVVEANGQIDHPDADTVFNAVISLEPVIDHVLTGIVDKKPAFAALPIDTIPSLILSDLKTLKGSSETLADALINVVPADLVVLGNAYKDELRTAFDNAIAAYK